MDHGYTLEQVLDLQDRIEDLENLVRWLALPLDGKTPIFARVNVYTGEPLMAGVALAKTWESVMGETEPAAPGRWVRCEACGSLYVESVVEAPVEGPAKEWADSFGEGVELSEATRGWLDRVFRKIDPATLTEWAEGQ